MRKELAGNKQKFQTGNYVKLIEYSWKLYTISFCKIKAKSLKDVAKQTYSIFLVCLMFVNFIIYQHIFSQICVLFIFEQNQKATNSNHFGQLERPRTIFALCAVLD